MFNNLNLFIFDCFPLQQSYQTISNRVLGTLLQNRMAHRSDAVVKSEDIFLLPQSQSVFQHQQN